MTISERLLQELEQEAETTRRVLERVPGDRLSWKPHPKSMSLGQLALHIATTPGGVAWFVSESVAPEPDFAHAEAQSAAELLPALEDSIANAKQILGRFDDDAMNATFRVVRGDQELMALPRAAFVRSVMLNHWYHHRGQLAVYLRQLNVPVPSIYGPSADENPFAVPVGAPSYVAPGL